MKRCSKCKFEKHEKEFHKDSSSNDGYYGQCKECKNSYASNYRDKNKDELKVRNKNWWLDNKLKIKEYNRKRRRGGNYKHDAVNYANYWCEKMEGFEKHHWNYCESNWGDVFYLTRSQHSKLHSLMKYDEKSRKYRKLDGALLKTMEEHEWHIITSLKLDYIYSFKIPEE